MWGEGEELPDKISQLVRDVGFFGEESCDVLIVEEEDGGGPTETAEPLIPLVGKKGERDPPLLQVVGEMHEVVQALVLELWCNQADQPSSYPCPHCAHQTVVLPLDELYVRLCLGQVEPASCTPGSWST